MLELINIYKIYLIIIIIIIIYIVFTSSESTIDKTKENLTNNYQGMEICGGQFADYIMATVDASGHIRWYPISYAAWHEPARNGKKIYGATDLNYDGGTSGLGRGILFKTDADIFKYPTVIPDDDRLASFGYDGDYGGGNNLNHRDAVAKIPPPNIFYKQDPLYLYRTQHGRNHVYKVFIYTNPTGEFQECCQDKTKDRKTCKPQYYETDTNSYCNREMVKFCQTNNNIFNSVCTKWCSDTDNEGNCKIYKNKFCNNGNNFKNNLSHCSKWAKDRTGGFGSVDDGVSEYCRNNLNDGKICACFQANAVQNNLSKEAKQVKEIVNARPICYSSECTTDGYMTNTMRDLISSCPKCWQFMSYANMSADNILFDNVKQECNADTKITTIKEPEPEPEPEPELATGSGSNKPPTIPKKITPIELLILKIKKILGIKS